MTDSSDERRGFIRCTNCGEIMTGTVTQAGRLNPVGVGNGGKCGDGEFERLSIPDSSAAESEG